MHALEDKTVNGGVLLLLEMMSAVLCAHLSC